MVHGLLIAVTSLVEHGLQALGLQQLWSLGSVVGSFLALEHRRSRCGTRACMWVPTQPGIEPVSSAMAGGFITTQATREAPAPVLGTEWTRGSRLTFWLWALLEHSWPLHLSGYSGLSWPGPACKPYAHLK